MGLSERKPEIVFVYSDRIGNRSGFDSKWAPVLKAQLSRRFKAGAAGESCNYCVLVGSTGRLDS